MSEAERIATIGIGDRVNVYDGSTDTNRAATVVARYDRVLGSERGPATLFSLEDDPGGGPLFVAAADVVWAVE